MKVYTVHICTNPPMFVNGERSLYRDLDCVMSHKIQNHTKMAEFIERESKNLIISPRLFFGQFNHLNSKLENEYFLSLSLWNTCLKYQQKIKILFQISFLAYFYFCSNCLMNLGVGSWNQNNKLFLLNLDYIAVYM